MRNWNEISIEKLKARGMVVDHTNPANNRNIVITENNSLLKKVRKKMTHEESDLQIKCVELFRLMYPKLKWRLFSIPNEGKRSLFQAAILVKRGMLPGVLDLFLAVSKYNYRGKYGVNFGGMFIECKSTTGRLSEYQIQFIKEMQKIIYVW